MDSSLDNMRFPTGENIASVHQLFAYQLSENPEAIAISFADNALTYKDLDKDSEKLANLILSKFPHSPIIGISSTRSVEMITGLIAIMKAGKAYLPLDPTYPR